MPEKILPSGVVIADTNEATGLVGNLTLKVANLDRVKRGDFVRLLLKFKIPATAQNPENPKATEFLTAVVASKTPNGLLKAKVFSRPEMTQFHSVTYGDDLTLAERYVVSHEQSTVAQAQEVEPFLTGVIPISQPVNAEDAKLRQVAQTLPPIAPEAGKRYWLRNGMIVTVHMFHVGVWVGTSVSDGTPLEWAANGANAAGNRDFDIVKDPRASEVVA
jgi:hypothetical protein